MKQQIFYGQNNVQTVFYKIENDILLETFDPKSDQEFLIPSGTRVLLTHKYFGHVTLDDVIEVHFNYINILPINKVAIEQKDTGVTYDLDDIVALWFNL
jgi:hypothetical protein